MKNLNAATLLLLLLPMSTFVVGCTGEKDADQRAALQKEALQRDLNLALQPDTTMQPELNDVADEETASTNTPPRAPVSRPSAPTREPEPEPAPRRPEPAPPPAPSRPSTVTLSAPAGSSFAVSLDQEISTENSAVGSTFTGTLREPLMAADGTILIPRGATVHGRVTESRKSGRAGQSAALAVEFTSISSGGESYSIDATTVEVPSKLVSRSSTLNKAEKVGGGAALGAILGQVIGKNTKSTVAGAAVGAIAGTAVAIGTDDVDRVIPAGSQATVRLNSPVRVTVTRD